MTTTARFDGILVAFQWIYDVLIGFIGKLSDGERLLLIANVCFAAVGAYSSYLFYAPARGVVIGWAAAIGIEALYLGGAGAAVKYPAQQRLARILVAIGALASAFFGVMVGLHEVFPAVFDKQATTVIWPAYDVFLVRGVPAIVEGCIPPGVNLILSWFLHSKVSSRLVETEQAEQRAKDSARPYECPFCPDTEKTAAALFGHFGRCTAAAASTLTQDEKKAIIRKAVEEGNARKA